MGSHCVGGGGGEGEGGGYQWIASPEPTDFQIGREEVAVEHEVFQSQIPVEDALFMAILHPADELLEESARPPETSGPHTGYTLSGKVRWSWASDPNALPETPGKQM